MPNYPNLYRNINQVYKDTKSNIEGLSGVNPGSIAFATDTNEWGFYNNSKWIWTANSSQADAIIRANSSGKINLNFIPSSSSSQPNAIVQADSSGKINLNFIPNTLTGKDADTLDGYHGSYYRDADTLDGYHGSYYKDADTLNGQNGNYYTNADNIVWGDQTIPNWLSFVPDYPIRDHFTTSTINSYWDGWAANDGFFGGAPGYRLNYNYNGHWLDAWIAASQANKIIYLYKSGTLTNFPLGIETQLGVDFNDINAGLMIWENNTKYIQLYIKSGIGTYYLYDAAIFKKTVNGGTTTETQISSTFPGNKIFKLSMHFTSSTACYIFASSSYISRNYMGTITLPTSFSPTRWGLFIMNRTSTGYRLAQFNYFAASF